MTISSTTNKSGPYIENGVTTEFEYAFKIENETHIQVVRAAGGVETILALGTHYTVTGVGNDKGNIVLVAPASGSTLTLVRDVPFVQELDLENQGAYFAEQVEAALDLAVARDQQLAEKISRAVVVPISADATDLETLIGGVVQLLDSVDAVVTVAAISTQVVAVAANAVNINTVAANIVGVQTTADNIAAILAAPGHASAAVAAAGAAAAAAVEAAADRVATGQDKTATAADRVQTGQDKTATAADRVATGQDRVATAADRVQTGVDRAAAAASAASVDASKIVHVTPDSFSPAQQGQARANIGADVLSGFRNKIINGRLLVAQRGLSGTIAAGAIGWMADRFQIQNSTNQPLTWQIGSSQSYGRQVEENRVSLSFASAPTSGDVYIQQRIPNVRTLAGRQVTSMVNVLDTGLLAGANLVSYFAQVFGSGGSLQVDTAPKTVDVTPTLVLKKALHTLAFVGAEKVIGSGDHLIAIWRFTPRASGYCVLTEFGVVEGDATAEADPFAARSLQDEKRLCRDFFRRITGLGVGTRIATGVGTGANLSAYCIPGTMRAIPAISYSGWTVAITGGVNSVTAMSVTSMSEAGITIGVTAATTVSDSLTQLRSNGPTDYIDFSAELS